MTSPEASTSSEASTSTTLSTDAHNHALPFEVSDELFGSLTNSVSSTQPSPHLEALMNGDAGGGLPVKKEDIDGVLGFNDLQDNSIAGWLGRLGLSAYIDKFQQNGYDNLFQLDEFNQHDLENMNIPEPHRHKIWKSLLDFHQAQMTDVTQVLHRSSGTSSAETLLSSQSQPSSSLSQQSVYNPGFYEVTRYTFKHTVTRSNVVLPAKAPRKDD